MDIPYLLEQIAPLRGSLRVLEITGRIFQCSEVDGSMPSLVRLRKSSLRGFTSLDSLTIPFASVCDESRLFRSLSAHRKVVESLDLPTYLKTLAILSPYSGKHAMTRSSKGRTLDDRPSFRKTYVPHRINNAWEKTFDFAILHKKPHIVFYSSPSGSEDQDYAYAVNYKLVNLHEHPPHGPWSPDSGPY